MNHQWTVILTTTNKAKQNHMHILLDVLRQQRKTTCLLSIRITSACARVSKLTTTNIYIARARCESQLAVGSSGLNARWPYGRADESKFLAWSSIAQSVGQRAFRLLAIWCLRPWVRILHSAEEDNVSPFDSNIFCLCQSIDINNNKYHKTKLNKTICIFMGCTTSAQMAPYGHKDPYYWLGARLMPVLSLNYSYF